MPITVNCDCGRSLVAPDEAVGKHGKCPACGNRLLIGASNEPILLSEAPSPMGLGFIAKLGEVKCRFSEMRFSFHIEKDGCAFLEIVTFDHVEKRNSHVTVLRLDDESYEQLIQVVRTAEDTVKKYRNSGPGKYMVEIYRA